MEPSDPVTALEIELVFVLAAGVILAGVTWGLAWVLKRLRGG